MVPCWRARAGAALCLAALAVGGLAPAPPRQGQPLRHPSWATMVAVLVKAALAPRVMAIEGALAVASRSLVAYCGLAGMSVPACADLATHHGSLTSLHLQAILTQQA